MQPFHTPPLKRHATMQPLSRDHYVALVQARHLLEAAKGSAVDRRAAVARFLEAWDAQIAPHFRDEETLLKPLADPGDRSRLIEEHRQLTDLAGEARDRRRQIDPGAAWMDRLGRLLRDHVRWEERELFGNIERSAGEALNTQLDFAQRIEASRGRGKGRSPRGTS